MNLAGLFSAKATSEQHMFFVVYFGEQTVRAALWKVVDGQIEVATLSNPQPWSNDQEVIDATDRALQELGKESEEVKQTLFALEPTWVSQQGILPDRKVLFQQLTKELALEAVGFVVIPEAIVQDVIYRKGTAFQCFVVEVLVSRVSMTLLKNGKLSQQEMVGRSSNTVDDIKEGFARFQDTPLPAVVLLYSSVLTIEELEECRQRLLALDLMSQFKFLQQPNFEVIPPDQIIDTIVQTGGRAVAEARELIVAGTVPQVTPTLEPALESATELDPGLNEDIDPELDEPELAPLVVETPPLASDVQVPTQSLFSQTPPSPVRATPSQVATQVPTPTLQPNVTQEDYFSDVDTVHHHAVDGTLLFGRFHLPHHPILFAAIGTGIGIFALLAVFLISSGSMLSALISAELKTAPLSKQLSLRLDPEAQGSDPNAGVLKAELIKQTVSGEKSAATTGKKLIGDKAKGKVTIFNRTSGSKTFPAGTVLQTGKLKYLTDQQVTVASASTGRNFETNPGTVEVAVTAAAIGVESNITGDTELTIDSYAKDTYIARSAGNLSGGTSREILAVSKKDQDDVLSELRKELTDQAVQQLQSQVGEGKYVFPTNRTKVTSSKFSAEVGKETNNFSLSLTVEAEALAYSSSELQGLADQALSGDIPAGYELPAESIIVNTEVTSTSTASAQQNITAQLSGVAKPRVDVNTWKSEIAGMPETEALQLLRQKSEVQNVTIARDPAFFAQFVKTLPTDTSKIDVQVR